MAAPAEKILDPFQKGPAGRAGEFLAAHGDLEVRVKMSEASGPECLLEKLEMRCLNGRPLNLDPVRVEKEVNYLGDPLKIMALEKYCGKALLRSFPPRRENGTVYFFELVIDRTDGLSLRRVAYDRNLGTRSQTPALLPRDTLERLLADLVSLASQN